MMTHVGHRGQRSPVTALEERVHALEGRVTALAEAVGVLAHGLEELPTTEPGQRPVAEAARRAYDLLLVAERPSLPTPPEGDPGPA